MISVLSGNSRLVRKERSKDKTENLNYLMGCITMTLLFSVYLSFEVCHKIFSKIANIGRF